jgi:short subunit dehydrogenase-like uncharacterized protein
MIYGANGYTGRLVANEAKRQGLAPVLAGRNADRVRALAFDLRLAWRAFDLGDATAAQDALADMQVVANCAGPFSATSRAMIDTCLAARTHYVDITGEIDVFVSAERRHADAKAAGIILCPGVGFDVIPTDCLAACLKQTLPDATHLALGFKGLASRSPGTARTSMEAAALGGRVRENGLIVTVPLADRTRNIDFGTGTRFAVAIPWGDVATAYFTTGIPNIETYVPTAHRSAVRMRHLNWMRPVFRVRPILAVLKHLAGRTNAGPSSRERLTGKTHVWGEARNDRGDVRTARVTTSNGYRLTVDGVLMAVRMLLARVPVGGYYTPTQLMGMRCVERLPGSSAIRIE